MFNKIITLAKVAIGLFIVLLTLLFMIYWSGAHWFGAYGTWLHFFGRIHVFFVHLTIGIVSAFILLEMVSQWGGLEAKFLPIKDYFFYSSHIALLLTLLTGTIMELIEHYPSEYVQPHLQWALSGYFLFLIYSGPKFFSKKLVVLNKKIYLAMACVFLLVFWNTGRLGGLIYKGHDFFIK